MKSIYYWILGIFVVIAVAGVGYLINSYEQPECLDGYGSAKYVDEGDFLAKLNNITTERDIHQDYLNLTSVAMEGFRCGDTTYFIIADSNWKKVSKSKFDEYIQSKDNLIRISQSGNSPYFVKDLETGKNYFIDKNGSTWQLIESN